MRKLALTMVLALVLPAAASARSGERGDGTFVAKNAVGQLTVSAKGAALGRVADGVIVVNDLSPNADDEIQVFGYDKKVVTRSDGSAIYQGTKMRFRIVGGLYSLAITGSGIDVTAVGKGNVTGQGVIGGVFSADGSPFRASVTPLYAAGFGLQVAGFGQP